MKMDIDFTSLFLVLRKRAEEHEKRYGFQEPPEIPTLLLDSMERAMREADEAMRWKT